MEPTDTVYMTPLLRVLSSQVCMRLEQPLQMQHMVPWQVQQLLQMLRLQSTLSRHRYWLCSLTLLVGSM